MRTRLVLVTAAPSVAAAMAAQYAAAHLGAPDPVAVGAAVVMFWLAAYAIAFAANATHRAAHRG